MIAIIDRSNKNLTPNKIFIFLELAFTVVSLLILSKGLFALLITGGANEGDAIDMSSFDYSIVSNLLTLVYLVTFILLAFRWKKVLALILRDKYILPFVAIAVLSYFWAEVPSATIRAAFSGVGATGFGVYLATRYTLKEQIKLFSWVYAVILILSILFAVLLPKYGVMSGIHEGAVRGIFTHKNGFGSSMVLGTIIFLISALSQQKKSNHNWFLWFCFSSSIVLVILSRSTSSLLNLLILLTLFFAAHIFRFRYETMVSVFLSVTLVGVIGIIWFSSNSDLFFAALGKDATLTGRTDIWSSVWDMIQQRPWLGYGLTGFWNGLNGPSAYILRAVGYYGLGTGPANSHNGFLEIWLSLGIIGLSVFLVGLVTNIFKAIARVRLSIGVEAFWLLLYPIYVLFTNLTESKLPAGLGSLSWVFYTAVAFSLLNPTGKR